MIPALKLMTSEKQVSQAINRVRRSVLITFNPLMDSAVFVGAAL